MNMNSKFLLAPALMLISGAVLWGQATAPAATKIALISMQDAMANTSEGKARIAALDTKYSPKQQEFQKRGQDIQTKTDQLKKTQNTLSEEAKATAQQEITRLQTALQRDIDDASADSEADQQKILQDLGPKLVEVVTKYSQSNQIMIVFDTSSQPNNLVCCASAPDITREVIALYDKLNPAAGAATGPAAAVKPAAPPATRPASSAPARPPARPPATPSK